MCALTGNPDGTSEVDYTVNPATGFPWATGPRELAAPLNSVLPAWDAIMGGLAVTGILAAERHRTRTGEGQLIRLALSDVAFAMVGNLGRIAEVAGRRPGRRARRQLPLRRLRPRLRHQRRAPRDGRRAHRAPVDGAGGGHRDRGGVQEPRGRHRPRPLLRGRALRRARPDRRGPAAVVRARARSTRSAPPSRAPASPGGRTRRSASWWRRTRARRTRTRCSPRSSSRGSAPTWCPPRRSSSTAAGRLPARRAPALGEHTEEILGDVLGLGEGEIGRLFDAGTVAGPD